MAARRSLSGTHLNEAVEVVKQKVLLRVEGKTAVGQSDGWKNVAKTNVTSTIMSVNHKVRALLLVVVVALLPYS